MCLASPRSTDLIAGGQAFTFGGPMPILSINSNTGTIIRKVSDGDVLVQTTISQPIAGRI